MTPDKSNPKPPVAKAGKVTGKPQAKGLPERGQRAKPFVDAKKVGARLMGS